MTIDIEKSALVYFDHNILDLMIKGRAEPIFEFLKNSSMVPVYSDGNLEEIERSEGKQIEFLDLLTTIRAWRISPRIVDFNRTGLIDISSQSPKERIKELRDNTNDDNSLVNDAYGFVEKIYGGKADDSFGDVLIKPMLAAKAQIIASLKETSEYTGEFTEKQRSDAKEQLDKFDDVLRQLASFASELDEKAKDGILTKQVEIEIGVGPKQLNNVKGPRVVEKLWEIIGRKYGAPEVELEQFFGVTSMPDGFSPDIPMNTSEKVDAIYGQLNFIGYYRDSNLDRPKRFTASLSDMNHAALASVCHVFFCNDKALKKKALAAYEFLDVNTHVLSLEIKNKQPTPTPKEVHGADS